MLLIFFCYFGVKNAFIVSIRRVRINKGPIDSIEQARACYPKLPAPNEGCTCSAGEMSQVRRKTISKNQDKEAALTNHR